MANMPKSVEWLWNNLNNYIMAQLKITKKILYKINLDVKRSLKMGVTRLVSPNTRGSNGEGGTLNCSCQKHPPSRELIYALWNLNDVVLYNTAKRGGGGYRGGISWVFPTFCQARFCKTLDTESCLLFATIRELEFVYKFSQKHSSGL